MRGDSAELICLRVVLTFALCHNETVTSNCWRERHGLAQERRDFRGQWAGRRKGNRSSPKEWRVSVYTPHVRYSEAINQSNYSHFEGCKVVALLRDPEKLPEDLRGQVTVIQGDVTNQDDVMKTVAGQDAVIVTLGTRNDLSEQLNLT